MARKKKSRTGSRKGGGRRMGAPKLNTAGIMDVALVTGGALLATWAAGKSWNNETLDKYKSYILLGAGLAGKLLLKNHMISELSTGVIVAGAMKVATEQGMLSGATVPLIIKRNGFPVERMSGFKVAPTIGSANPVNNFPRPSGIGQITRRRYHSAT